MRTIDWYNPEPWAVSGVAIIIVVAVVMTGIVIYRRWQQCDRVKQLEEAVCIGQEDWQVQYYTCRLTSSCFRAKRYEAMCATYDELRDNYRREVGARTLKQRQYILDGTLARRQSIVAFGGESVSLLDNYPEALESYAAETAELRHLVDTLKKRHGDGVLSLAHQSLKHLEAVNIGKVSKMAAGERLEEFEKTNHEIEQYVKSFQVRVHHIDEKLKALYKRRKALHVILRKLDDKKAIGGEYHDFIVVFKSSVSELADDFVALPQADVSLRQEHLGDEFTQVLDTVEKAVSERERQAKLFAPILDS